MRYLVLKRLILLFMLLAAPAFAIGVDEETLPDPAQEARARAIMEDLRCLVCQNQSIEESDADMAADLRRLVRERIAAGDTEAEVKTYLVDRFGDWILMRPPVKPATWLLWSMPVLLVIIGGVAFGLMVRRRRSLAPEVEAQPLSDDERAQLESAQEPNQAGRREGGS